jgi:hypothetical protein
MAAQDHSIFAKPGTLKLYQSLAISEIFPIFGVAGDSVF